MADTLRGPAIVPIPGRQTGKISSFMENWGEYTYMSSLTVENKWTLLSSYLANLKSNKAVFLEKNSRILIGVQKYPASNKVNSQCCSVAVLSSSFWPHGLQHARIPNASLSPRVHSSSCPLSQWCHPTISSSGIPFSSCPHCFPASGSFPASQLFTSGGHNVRHPVRNLPIACGGLLNFLPSFFFPLSFLNFG